MTKSTTGDANSVLYTGVPSPIGELLISGEREDPTPTTTPTITGLYIPGHDRRPGPGWVRADNAFTQPRHQLRQYFAGERRHFDLQTQTPGTPFQHRVWNELGRIEYGHTASYGQIARAVGSPAASQAVGGANGRNPLSIIVPCHRVVASNGKHTGHGNGPSAKTWLLEHERQHLFSSGPVDCQVAP